jgi:hypothetical protein
MVTPEDPAPRTGRSSEPVESLQSDGPGHANTSGQERPWQRTDAANAELFAILHGGRVRYDHRRGRWLVWAGDWWRPDETGEVRIMAKETARLRYQDAARIEDLKERTQEAGFALRSEDRYRLEAMLSQARSEPPIADADDRWDADPGLFGVTNGIVDLRTGFERNHLLEDHLIGVGHRALPCQCAASQRWMVVVGSSVRVILPPSVSLRHHPARPRVSWGHHLRRGRPDARAAGAATGGLGLPDRRVAQATAA